MNSNAFFSFTAIAAAVLLTGCASSGSSAPTVTNPYSATGSSTLGEVHVNTMRVFGDSYSDPSFTGSLGHHQLVPAAAGPGPGDREQELRPGRGAGQHGRGAGF